MAAASGHLQLFRGQFGVVLDVLLSEGEALGSGSLDQFSSILDALKLLGKFLVSKQLLLKIGEIHGVAS